jgi:mxaC protein
MTTTLASLAFSDPWWLVALPLALLPLLRRDPDTVTYSSLSLAPADRLSDLLGWLLRIAAAAVIVALALALAGLHRPRVTVEQIGSGAEIVLLLDRSRSMDDPLSGKTRQFVPLGDQFGGNRLDATAAESKGAAARRLLAEFAAKRREDLFALVLFSTTPIPVMAFTQKQEMIQAAIKAGGIGRGLADTDMGRGLVAAAGLFEGRGYAGSRLILMVSDGGATLDYDMKERLQALFKRHRIGIYWIYLRTPGSAGLQETAGAPVGPERSLHLFFSNAGIPYHAYEAEDPDALKRAIADVGRLENLPIRYQETLPRFDFAGRCYALAAIGCAALFAVATIRVRSWP